VNELKIFDNPQFGEIRTVCGGDGVWFVAADACKALEHTNVTVALNRLDDDEKAKFNLGLSGGETNCINEPGLYSLVLGSRKPEAKAFKRWVTHEVLPSIRRHGLYAMDELLDNPDLAINALVKLKEERERRKALESENAQQKQLLAEFSPKASYYDLVLQTPDLMSATQIAKDFGKSARWLNKLLHEKGVQFKQRETWLLYQKHAEQGYTKSKTETYSGRDGTQHSRLHTYWTQKGRLFIYDLLKADGILPLIERTEGTMTG